ncbi:hypothetical protein S40288_02710 [Stachybotrys chartarum IBT 40288]|nr:hypothetical protein S40288_02710 [Stachybotrys chartarum IBT 40288]
MDFYRQINTLAEKTFRIIVLRHFTTALYSALLLPIIAALYLGIGQNLNNPNDNYGIADPTDIYSLPDALGRAGGGRDTVAFVNSGYLDGDIQRVIDDLSRIVTDAGRTARTLSDEIELATTCQTSFRGTSNCFGAVVFHSSPDEGSDNSVWNYTLRADVALGRSFQYDQDDNDAEVYALPLQRAVDSAIANIASDGPRLPETRQYAFTDETEDERAARVRREYQASFIDYLSVGFLVALVGVSYHLPGFMATEREKGLSQLIDAMMPVRHGWERQAARLASHHVAFTSAYLPGWVIAAIICRVMIWEKTSYGIIIPFFILGGLAMTSMSLLGGAFFKKAQLSGAVTAIVWLVFGIVAQVLRDVGNAPVIVLGLLFTPCNIVFSIVYIARWEQEDSATDLLEAPPNSPWGVPSIVLWIFLLVQIFAYPLIAAYLERFLHGVNTGVRTPLHESADASFQDAVRIENVTKVFRPSFLRKLFSFVSPPRPEVVAVSNLTLSAKKGQILALLGANGSGKSTTLDAIAGISNFTSGSVSIDTLGGLGIAPQSNVLWDELTVEEHIQIFNRLKCPSNPASREEIYDLIKAIGLKEKIKAQSKTLSGGQKRKLQLGMMLTGGSAVCCVDEVSSGIDPLSRRKIWDILLAERGTRTIIMTTHFLDEADLLADNIAILSKGKLQAQGTAAELKNSLGAGYRFYVQDPQFIQNPLDIEGVPKKVDSNTVTYFAPSSALAAEVIRVLEFVHARYRFSGPTIEDVFLKVAEEARADIQSNSRDDLQKESSSLNATGSAHNALDGLRSGNQIGIVKQISVLLRKRFIIFKTNWIPYVIAFLIPVIAAAITQLLVSGEDPVSCSPSSRVRDGNEQLEDLVESIFLVSGPRDDFANANLGTLLGGNGGGDELPSDNFTLVNSFGEFQRFIEDRRRDVTPGGWYLGSDGTPAIVAYRADQYAMYTSVIVQNLMNAMLTNTTIVASYDFFDLPVDSSVVDTLQLVVYLGLAFSIFPALFGFYPNTERRMNVRGLHYSSGARALPLWIAHLSFDFAITLLAMVICIVVYAAASDIWYNVGYLFPVFLLYGLASILLAYVISLVTGSALATFAATTAYQSVGLAIYLIAYLFILTFSNPSVVDRDILLGHWVISIFFPIGSLVRALLVSINVFNVACSGQSLQPNPGAMTAYGGPILYLALQTVLLFSLLVWCDSGASNYATGKATPSPDSNDPEIAEELVRINGPGEATDGLRVKHLTKAFGKTTAVDNVSFGVEHGEVFALLGPNGAGKSTTISLIRGDLAPSRNGGDVFVENISISKNRASARQNLGVCPQFDAIDSMTVREHLEHYARLRGIPEVKSQVQAVVRAVGLEPYTDVMAHTLSGGNKRKLSLGIALTGNPSVILLDEPSSGLDAAAKRVMWRTLETIVPGRSILLTTHSMEEADALATRAGIMARRMLALGATENLRRRFGDTLHVHLVARSAPHSSQEEMAEVARWVAWAFPEAVVEQATYHGQMRFSLPAQSVAQSPAASNRQSGGSGSAIGQLLVILEENKDLLGIAHHSVSPTTLEQVFLTIVGQHDVKEEGYRVEQIENKSSGKTWVKRLLWPF